jgi:hypothetical protein
MRDSEVIMFLSAHFPIEVGLVIYYYSLFSEPPADFIDTVKTLWRLMQRVLFNGGEISLNVDFGIRIDFPCRCKDRFETLHYDYDTYSRIVFLDSSTGNIDIEIPVGKLYDARCLNAIFDPTPRRLTLTPSLVFNGTYGIMYKGTGPLWTERGGIKRTLWSSAHARLDVDGRPNNEPGDTKPHVIFISDNL